LAASSRCDNVFSSVSCRRRRPLDRPADGLDEPDDLRLEGRGWFVLYDLQEALEFPADPRIRRRVGRAARTEGLDTGRQAAPKVADDTAHLTLFRLTRRHEKRVETEPLPLRTGRSAGATR
jgi:hypothetical protein